MQLEPAAVTGRCSRTGFQEDTHTHTGIVPPGLLSSTTKGNGEGEGGVEGEGMLGEKREGSMRGD